MVMTTRRDAGSARPSVPAAVLRDDRVTRPRHLDPAACSRRRRGRSARSPGGRPDPADPFPPSLPRVVDPRLQVEERAQLVPLAVVEGGTLDLARLFHDEERPRLARRMRDEDRARVAREDGLQRDPAGGRPSGARQRRREAGQSGHDDARGSCASGTSSSSWLRRMWMKSDVTAPSGPAPAVSRPAWRANRWAMSGVKRTRRTSGPSGSSSATRSPSSAIAARRCVLADPRIGLHRVRPR